MNRYKINCLFLMHVSYKDYKQADIVITGKYKKRDFVKLKSYGPTYLFVYYWYLENYMKNC